MVQHCHLDGSEGSQAKKRLPFSKRDKKKTKCDTSVSMREPSEDHRSPTRGTLLAYLNIN